MASGTLGKASLVANTETAIYGVGGSSLAVFTINVLNMNPVASAKVRIGITNQVSLSVQDYIEYDVVIPAGGVLERSGIVMSPLDTIYVKSDTANVTVRVYGYENPA